MPEVLNKEKLLEQAKKLAAEGKFDRAIAEYQKLLQADPSDLRIKVKVAELYIKRKQINDAITIYREVALKYVEGNFFLKAVTVYKNILRLNPSLVDINLSLAELYEKMGLIPDALNQYHIVVMALEQKNDRAGVLATREKMLSLDLDNISLRERLAETYQLEGMEDKAIEAYEALAELVKKSGSVEQLIELYNKILAHKPERQDLISELCRMHYKRGEWKEVLKKTELSKEFTANEPELLNMQADVFARLNQIESAKGKYRDLAALLLAKNDPVGAIKAYENILYLSPEEEEAVLKEVEQISAGEGKNVKARADERRLRSAEAEATQEVAAQKEETISTEGEKGVSVGTPQQLKDARSNFDLGMMYKQTGLDDEARSEFEKAFKILERIYAGGGVTKEVSGLFERVKKELGREERMEKQITEKQITEKLKTEKQIERKAEEKPDEKKIAKKKISFV